MAYLEQLTFAGIRVQHYLAAFITHYAHAVTSVEVLKFPSSQEGSLLVFLVGTIEYFSEPNLNMKETVV